MSHRHTVPAGQLFLSNNLTLTATPQTQQGLRGIMSTSSLIFKRKAAEKAEEVDTKKKQPKVSLARLQPLTGGLGSELRIEDVSDDEEALTELPNAQVDDFPVTEERLELAYNTGDLEYDEFLTKVLVWDDTPFKSTDPKAAAWTKEHINSTCNKKENNISALIMFLMTPLLVPLEAYRDAYDKFRSESKSMSLNFRSVLHKVLSLWGTTLANVGTGSTGLLKDWLDSENLRSSLSTIVFPARARKTLLDWLTHFSEEFSLPAPPGERAGTPAVSPAFTLPDPTTMAAHTSTLFMPVRGISHSVGALDSKTSVEVQGGSVGHVDLSRFHLKTSRNLSTISFNQGEYRCTLRSPNNAGDLAIKLETYRWSDIANKPAVDYWRHAQAKGFVLCPINSRMANLAAQLEHEMIQQLNKDPESVGELTYRK